MELLNDNYRQKKSRLETLVSQWNNTKRSYPSEKAIHQLFEEQCKKTPNNIALVHSSNTLTYTELNQKANQLARHLRHEYQALTSNPLAPNTLIALRLDRSLEMVITILAVLKAGAAYVPIDPSYPTDRLSFILRDTDTKLLLTQSHLAAGVSDDIHTQQIITDLNADFYDTENTDDLNIALSSQDLAYVIYTSGTTGQPKGVMIPHRGIINRLTWMQDQYPLSEQDVVLQKTPYVFDVSVWELFWAHWYGAKLIMAEPDGHKDSRYLYQLIDKERVTTLHFVPSMLDAYNSYLSANNLVLNPSINQLFCSGEALHTATVNRTYDLSDNATFKLHNLYGPTEASIDVTYYEAQPHQDVYIGKPIANTMAFILDSKQRPVPIGTPGELYIGGAGLALGYLNRPELSDERFVDNRFATDEDIDQGYTKLYRTGDLAQWMADGNIQYLGRNDDQVKVRGYRIELGEIECKLREIDTIDQACVLAKSRKTEAGESKYLVCYYTSVAGHHTTDAQIISELSHQLPDYMVPTAFVQLSTFPVTINGKLDRKSLPEPTFSAQENYVAPRNDLDAQLCALWQDILGLEKIGIRENFFALGGDSILATLLSTRMSGVLDREIKVADIFNYKTIEGILSDCPMRQKIEITKREELSSPLSFAQDRLWFIENYEGGTSAYHIPCLYHLKDEAHIDVVKQAIQAVVQRHEALRTTIKQSGAGDVQVVSNEPVSIEQKQIQADEDFTQRLREDINAPFDLTAHYPLKVTIYRTGDITPTYSLLVNFHHIVSDGWSVDIFERDVQSYYDAFVTQTKVSLPELPIQYLDHAHWQREYLKGDAYQNQIHYWKSKLAGLPTLELPTDHPRPSKISYEGKHETFSMDTLTSDALRALAKQTNCTLHTITLSLFSILLSKYCNQNDVVTGTPIANRHLAQTQDLIGLFINTQVNRLQINGEESFLELIERVQLDQVNAQQHQDIPFERLMEELQVERELSRHPIFQVMFGVQGFGQVDTQSQREADRLLLPFTDLNDIYEYARFDMEFFIDDRADELQGIIRYASQLFKSSSIISLISRFKYLVEQVVQSPDTCIKALSIVQPQELKQLTLDWNNTDKDFPRNKTIHQLFEDQVAKTPDATAIVFEGTRLTYRELNDRANQLARYIRAHFQHRTGHALCANTLIALHLERGVEMMVSVLAVLKAGAAYVPIDPSYPIDRTRFMLEDTQADLVLALNRTMNKELAAQTGSDWLTVDLSEPLYQHNDSSNLAPYSLSEDLAYVLYTSGTTGQPKGAMLSHRGIVNRISWMQNQYPLCESDVVLQKTPYVFDVSVWELFWAHWYGATQVIAKPDGHKDSDYLNRLISEQQVTTLHFVPSMLEAYNGFLLSSEKALPTCVKQMFCSGEALNSATVEQTYELAQRSEFKLHNLYGPTEASIDVTSFETKAGNPVSIGKPIDNTRVYILDEDKYPVPIGVVGELYLGGAGLACGYLNRPELTSQKFVENRFATESDLQQGYSTLYKTGDLVRWLPDGNIDYIGRNDDQIKIRGHRVELEEITSKLRAVDGIKQACVVVKKKETTAGSTQYLAAYYTKTDDSAISDERLLSSLANDLPDYMLPSVFVAMDAFPLTINGKLDRRSLPEPTFNVTRSYQAPLDKVEACLCQIWQEVIGLKQVGTGDNFFRIGGDSILAIRAVYLSNHAGYQISVANIFLYPTIGQLANFVRENQGNQPVSELQDYQPFSLVERAQLRDRDLDTYEDMYPVSYTQLGIISENLKRERLVHTDNFHFKVLHPYSHSTLVSCLNALLQRHELLRSVICTHPEYNYLICEKKQYSAEEYLVVHTLTDDDYHAFDGEAFGHHWFATDPVINNMAQTLFQLHIVVNEKDNSSFTVVGLFNHVIADGWSLNLFSSQLMDMYVYDNQPAQTERMKYAEFIANEQRCVTQSDSRAFWQHHLNGYELKSNLELHNPAQCNDPNYPAPLIPIESLWIDKANTLCDRLNINIDIVFIAATYVLMSKFNANSDIALGYVQNNRPEKLGSESTFGYFLNPIPMRINDISNDPVQLLNTINHVRSQLLEHKLYPYPLIQRELESSDTIYNMAFNYISFKGIDEFAGTDIDQYMNTGLEDVPAYVEIRDIKGKFYLQLNVQQDNVDAYYQQYLTQYYLFYLETILNEAPITNLMPNEYERMTSVWNNTDKAYPDTASICHLFEQQCRINPHHIALYYDGKTLTYQEVNSKANQLARVIQKAYFNKTQSPLSSGSLIAICMDRGLEMIVGILAVLKAGGAYVPIDPSYPEARINYILDDTQAELVLTLEHLVHACSDESTTTTATHSYLRDKAIFVDLTSTFYRQEDTANLPTTTTPDDIAYVIYTSGTSGQPKGALLSHRALINFIHNQSHTIGIHANSRVLQYASIVFDASVWSTFSALCYGAQLFLVSDAVRKDSKLITRYLEQHQVNIALLPPALVNVIDHIELPHLQTLLVGGDICLPKHMHFWGQGRKLINAYGPTESTVYATTHHYQQTDSNTNIGKPINNMKVYVLDAYQNPVPLGVKGELYLSGCSLANGYLNLPDVTNEKFVSNPFTTALDPALGYTRMYKTGDTVKWLPNGDLQFVGRYDNQVKIRGYRIETGEIETQLRAIEGVKQACVLAKSRMNKGEGSYLVGYYTSHENAELSSEGILSICRDRLPEYMLPSILIPLDTFPLTVNGKINKHALPEPNSIISHSYTPPTSDIEKRLCVIWQQVLELNKVGINDDFFKAGGESISAIRLSNRITAELSYQVSVANIFRYRTISSLLENVPFHEQSTTYGEL
ncbi:non-ribosomal peptide synthetase [Vibrio coralliilyticus]|uniref:non-ribosomal peptide synthetase n=1 Tax=Vibrio coralliilyticus TaxID=190893 RepID=UPI000C16CB48|nr:non-ribosomal peptide synthetase [Vibrio coralliilyticus]